MDVTQTLAGVAASLRGAAGARLQLDSWFYPHEKTRAVNPQGQGRFRPRACSPGAAPDLLPDGSRGCASASATRR
jgi:hypothetical protein